MNRWVCVCVCSLLSLFPSFLPPIHSFLRSFLPFPATDSHTQSDCNIHLPIHCSSPLFLHHRLSHSPSFLYGSVLIHFLCRSIHPISLFYSSTTVDSSIRLVNNCCAYPVDDVCVCAY